MIEIVKAPKDASSQFKVAQVSLEHLLSRKELGFWQLPQRQELWGQCLRLGSLMRGQYESMVLVGIGGSSLGPRVILDVFNIQNVHLLDNVDAIQFERLLRKLGDLSKVLFVFISKSGTTIETLCTLEFLREELATRGLHLDKQSCVITEERASSLYDWSRSHSIPTLPVPFDVGGRFSVLSPVGMFLAAWSGLDLDKFRRGAEGALTNKITVTEFTAQVLASFSRSEWITLFWFYCSELYSLGLWLQQLWAESLAKATDRRGAPAPRVSTPMCAIGASDQHSILQQVMEGARDKFVVFLRVSEAESEFRKLNAPIFSETQNLRGRGMGGLLAAEAEATEEALSHSGVSTLVLRTKVLDEQTLGYLFMFFELVVGALGEALDINAFDQPGVELGKRLAKQKMAKV